MFKYMYTQFSVTCISYSREHCKSNSSNCRVSFSAKFRYMVYFADFFFSDWFGSKKWRKLWLLLVFVSYQVTSVVGGRVRIIRNTSWISLVSISIYVEVKCAITGKIKKSCECFPSDTQIYSLHDKAIKSIYTYVGGRWFTRFAFQCPWGRSRLSVSIWQAAFNTKTVASVRICSDTSKYLTSLWFSV